MSQFGVLNSRKRAIIALIHSVVFLGIAAHGFVSRKPGMWHAPRATGDLILIAVYLVVASILIWVVSISRAVVERLYFALCATSATSGLVRTALGDRAVPAAQYVRVLMLASAVAIGSVIVRSCSQSLVSSEEP